jgi:hypothetical protein
MNSNLINLTSLHQLAEQEWPTNVKKEQSKWLGKIISVQRENLRLEEVIELIEAFIQSNPDILKDQQVVADLMKIDHKAKMDGLKTSHIQEVILENTSRTSLSAVDTEGMQKLDILKYKFQDEGEFIKLTCLINGHRYDFKLKKDKEIQGINDLESRLLRELQSFEAKFKDNFNYSFFGELGFWTPQFNYYKKFILIPTVEQIEKALLPLAEPIQSQDAQDKAREVNDWINRGKEVDPDLEAKLQKAIKNIDIKRRQVIGRFLIDEGIHTSAKEIEKLNDITYQGRYAHLQPFFFLYLDYSDRTFAKKALKSAILQNNTLAVQHILSFHRDLLTDDEIKSKICAAIEHGLLNVVNLALDSGLKADFTLIRHFGLKWTPQDSFYNLLQAKFIPNEAEQAQMVKYLESLLNQGLSSNAYLNLSGETSCSLLEGLYLCLNESKSELCQKLMRILLDRGAIITPRIAHAMKFDMKASKNSFYVSDLKKQGFLTDVEARILLSKEEFKKGSASDLLNRMLSAKMLLDRYSQFYHLCPSAIPLEVMAQIKDLKKEIKEHLASEPNTKTTEELQALYRDFSKTYDAVIDNHPFLRTLKEISQEIRQMAKGAKEAKPSMRLVRFYSLWSPDQTYGYSDAEVRLKKLLTNKRSLYWKEIR